MITFFHNMMTSLAKKERCSRLLATTQPDLMTTIPSPSRILEEIGSLLGWQDCFLRHFQESKCPDTVVSALSSANSVTFALSFPSASYIPQPNIFISSLRIWWQRQIQLNYLWMDHLQHWQPNWPFHLFWFSAWLQCHQLLGRVSWPSVAPEISPSAV